MCSTVEPGRARFARTVRHVHELVSRDRAVAEHAARDDIRADKVAVDPLDGVAHLCGDLSWRERELLMVTRTTSPDAGWRDR